MSPRSTLSYSDLFALSYDETSIRVEAHAVVLSACSSYFAAMLAGPLDAGLEQPIDVWCAPSLFVQFLDYLYTGQICLTDVRHALSLLVVGETFGKPSLAVLCAMYLADHITETGDAILALAVLHEYYPLTHGVWHAKNGDAVLGRRLEALLRNSRDLLCSGFGSINMHSDLHALSPADLASVVSSDNLQASSEGQVLKLLIAWITFSDERMEYAEQLLGRVRYVRIPDEEMDAILEGCHSDLIAVIREAADAQRAFLEAAGLPVHYASLDEVSSEEDSVFGGREVGSVPLHAAHLEPESHTRRQTILRQAAFHRRQPLDVARLQKHRVLDTEGVSASVLIALGMRVLAGLDDGRIAVYSVTGTQWECVIHAHADACSALAVVESGSWLISGAVDGEILVWDTSTWECTAELAPAQDAPGGDIRSIAAISSDLVATGDALGELCVWDLSQGARVMYRKFDTGIRCVLRRGKRRLFVAVGNAIYAFSRLENDEWRCIKRVEGHRYNVCSLAYWGGHLVSGSTDCTIKVWEVASWRVLCTLRGHRDCVWALKLCGASQLVSASQDTTIALWDTHSWKKRKTFTDHTSAVRSLVFCGNYMVTAARDGLWVWKQPPLPHTPSGS